MRIRCLLCDFEAPIREETVMLAHFKGQHSLAAPVLKRYVALVGLPVPPSP
jgi:hypothetical protein